MAGKGFSERGLFGQIDAWTTEDAAPATSVAKPTRTAPVTHGAEGHRARMRGKLLQAGPDALLDHELLEMVLFLALPRRDTKPIARALLGRFGSYAAAIAAAVADLRRIDGLGEAGIAALKTVHAAALRLARAEIVDGAVLASWPALEQYLHVVLARERVEHFRVLFLNSRNKLLADEIMGRGTINHTPVYPREIAKRALEQHATAIILVHNHPSGDPTASRDDIQMTRAIEAALRPLEVLVHDHIIVGNGRCLSLRQSGKL